MSQSDKSTLIRRNTLCWLAAVLAPLILHFGSAGTKFPWPLILPLLLLGPMLASNKLLSKAADDSAEQPKPR